VLFALSAPVRAQDSPHPLEGVDTSSPRATLQSFLESTHAVYEGFQGAQRSLATQPQR
jgi:hypothetical protein